MRRYPEAVDLPERTETQSNILKAATKPIHTAGPQQALLKSLRIVYAGDAEPIELRWAP